MEGADLAPPHPGHEEVPCDHGVEAAPLAGDGVGLDAAAAAPRAVAGGEDGGEDGGEVRGPEGAGLSSASIAAATAVAALADARP